jgi:hypothetical protein
MQAWTDRIDPATIPDEVLASERGRRNSARRQTNAGGRNGGRPVCACGTCRACQKRAATQKRAALPSVESTTR